MVEQQLGEVDSRINGYMEAKEEMGGEEMRAERSNSGFVGSLNASCSSS